MRKIISVCIVACILLSGIYTIQDVISIQEKQIEINNAIGALAEMYKNDEQYRNELEDSDEDSVCIANRIIIKSDYPISNTYDSNNSIYSFGYNYIQYKNEEVAQYAFNKFEEQGYHPFYDSVFENEQIEQDEKEYKTTSTPDSSAYSLVENTEFNYAYAECDINAALDYYKYKLKSNIVIAVIDTGLYYDLDIFKNRIIRTHMDFSADNSNDEKEITTNHGTFVSSIIALCTPSNVKIECFKIADKNGKIYQSSIELALSYINEMDNKPDIINMSFSGPKDYTALENNQEELINQLHESGTILISSMGNAGNTASNNIVPASYENVISVAGTFEKGSPAKESSHSYFTDISAPFGFEGYEYAFVGNNTNVVSALRYHEGTSFSAPIVASAAALTLMEHKDYTPNQVKDCLLKTAIPFRTKNCDKEYGVGVVNFSNIIDGTRCNNVTSNYKSDVYQDNISVELKSSNTLVNIIYTTDGSLPTLDNGTTYTKPIEITKDTRILAAAYPKVGSMLHSKFLCLDYYIQESENSDFLIDNDGTILSYLGNDKDIVVPNMINGIVPQKIGPQCFAFSDINSIVLPDSIVELSEYAFNNTPLTLIIANGVLNIKNGCFKQTDLKNVFFPKVEVIKENVFFDTPIETANLPKLKSLDKSFYKCNKLIDITIPAVETISNYAFYGCNNCNCDLIAPKLTSVTSHGLTSSGFKSIIADECSLVTERAFANAKAETIKLGKVKTMMYGLFRNCENLHTLYLPNLINVEGNMTNYTEQYYFLNCKQLSLIFIPKAKNLKLDIPNDLKIYADSKFSFLTNDYNHNYTCISFPGSNFEECITNANTNKLKFVSVENYADALGSQIRINNIGMRFGFSWKRLAELEDLASSVTYGFLMTYSDVDSLYYDRADKRIFANNIVQDEDITNFNMVLTKIPNSELDTVVSVRAYVNIDGMYFYSPIIKSSYNMLKSNTSENTNLLDKCDTEILYTEAHEHNYIYYEFSDEKYCYGCSNCGSKISKSISELPVFKDYINTRVTCGNDNMYLDVIPDGIINAKDYAKIYHLSKYGW